MSPRDRRALGVLGLWALLVAAWLAGSRGLQAKRDWDLRRSKVLSLETRAAALETELRTVQARRSGLQLLPSRLKGVAEDELRLMGQEALLAASQNAGLKGLRLRPEPGGAVPGLRILQWNLEGEGTLAQWVDALQAMEASQPFMAVQSIKLRVEGDPWSLPADAGGPALKGSALCVWSLPEASQ